MANPHRGEVVLSLNGEVHVLRLTLGALAELETILDEDGLVALVERFETGAFSARDLLALLGAALKGGGSSVPLEALAAAQIAGGAQEAARVAARLLALSFAGLSDPPREATS